MQPNEALDGRYTRYRCPYCHASVTRKGKEYLCVASECPHAATDNGFKIYDETPIFISSQTDSVCDSSQGTSYIPRRSPRALTSFSRRLRGDHVTQENCRAFCELSKELSTQPRILIIGSGNPGLGTKLLWADNKMHKHGVDVYKTKTVHTICDAHYLPFEDNAFDGVWIQAVLEHVVEPTKVVEEIHRVLRPDGLVYAETPFMQQVHESAYDFTRFTVLGHRYLFRDFREIYMGTLGGPDLALAWSLKCFVEGITRSKIAARIAGTTAALLLRPSRVILSRSSIIEGCSGSFFLGRRANECQVSHREIIGRYKTL